MNIELEENERIDELDCGGLKIIQNKKFFCFGIDSVLLSEFARDIRKNSFVVDMGTGNGILPILLSEKTQARKIVGIEVQEELVELANRNVRLNHLENKIEIMHCNIKEAEKYIQRDSVDAIVTNPPYKKVNTGIQNENKNKLIARHEIEATLEDFIKMSYSMLKDRGTFYMVHRTERLTDIFYYLRKNKMEPKEVRFIQDSVYMPPQLVLIKAVKNAHAFLKVKETIYIRGENGKVREEE